MYWYVWCDSDSRGRANYAWCPRATEHVLLTLLPTAGKTRMPNRVDELWYKQIVTKRLNLVSVRISHDERLCRWFWWDWQATIALSWMRLKHDYDIKLDSAHKSNQNQAHCCQLQVRNLDALYFVMDYLARNHNSRMMVNELSYYAYDPT